MGNPNPKRAPLSNDDRHTIIDAIDRVGGVAEFAKRVSLSTSCIGHALNGEGILPASAAALRLAAQDHVFGLVRAARGAHA